MFTTPATLIYISQLILTLTVGGYLIYVASTRRSSHTGWLAVFFLALSAALVLFAVVSSRNPAERRGVVIWQAAAGSLLYLPLFSFAYTFPQPFKARYRERAFLTVTSGVYTLVECGFALYRAVELAQGRMHFRAPEADLITITLAATVPLALLRQRAALNAWRGTRPAATLRGYFRPLDREARALTSLAVVLSVMVAAAGSTFLFGAVGIPDGAPAAVLALISTVTIFTATMAYLNVLPTPTSLLIKLLGLILATLAATLAVLSGLSLANRPWKLALDLPEQQTLQLTPTDQNGYRITEIPLKPPTAQIQRLLLQPGECSRAIPFSSSYFGQSYSAVTVCADGAISFDGPIDRARYQYRYGAGTPILLPLLADLDPTVPGASVSYTLSSTRLSVAWLNVGLTQQSDARFTFQVSLQNDGTITLSYGDLPTTVSYRPGDRAPSAVSAIGVIPAGSSRPLPAQVHFSAAAAEIGRDGAVQDLLLEYRTELHSRIAPGIWVAFALQLVVLLVFPILFHASLVRPLQDLLRGVERLEKGEYDLTIRPYASDELGTLARAFNQMAARLRRLISTLEERVAGRTADLDAANRRLRAEILERLDAEQNALEHQRVTAALQERERLARDLHDSLGQTLGSISLQVGTALALLDQGDIAGARRAWEQVSRSVSRGHSDVRNVIRQLRTGLADGFWPALTELVSEIRLASSLQIDLVLNEAWSEQWLSPLGAINVLRIIQEALNNVLRHAGATIVTIGIRREADQLLITVTDDGRGFNPIVARAQSNVNGERLGLLTMQERAEELDGSLAIHSAPGAGTTISLSLPLETTPPDVPQLTLPSAEGR